MGSFALTVVATDTTAGLNTVVFPETVSAGETWPQTGAHNVTVAHPYTFDANDVASAEYAVTVTDRATNLITIPFSVCADHISPTVTLTVPERLTTTQILVQWSVVESGSGIRGYDLDVSDDGGASWTHLLTETQATTYTFTGTLGVAYTFRVRATDNVNNVSAWVEATAKTVVVKKYYSVAGQRIAMRANGVLYYLHTDHLGSTSLTTDQTGAVVAEQRYLPYGEVRWVSGTLMTDLTYTGQRTDEIGLMDYRARFYNSRLGRFVSADSVVPGIGSLSLNRYIYVSGNPLRYIDPTGHFSPEQIREYLERAHRDITDEKERNAKIEQVLARWQQDQEWWSILENAEYGDILDGTQLNLFGMSSTRSFGSFVKSGDTFAFIGYQLNGEIPQLPGNRPSAFAPDSLNLVNFYDTCSDIIWARPFKPTGNTYDTGGHQYMGGTGYAKGVNGISVRWDQWGLGIMKGAVTMASLLGGLAALGSPEPFSKPIAVGAFIGCGYEMVETWRHGSAFQRSVDAVLRFSTWQ